VHIMRDCVSLAISFAQLLVTASGCPITSDSVDKKRGARSASGPSNSYYHKFYPAWSHHVFVGRRDAMHGATRRQLSFVTLLLGAVL
jgi:hypothetical protein